MLNYTTTTIVNTGAGTIVTGAIGAGSMVTTLGYYLASRKKLM
jgi:LPXTG-motif cell wall-anchored protein